MVEHLLGIYKVLGSISGTGRKGLNALVTFSPLTEAELELGIRSEQKRPLTSLIRGSTPSLNLQKL